MDPVKVIDEKYIVKMEGLKAFSAVPVNDNAKPAVLFHSGDSLKLIGKVKDSNGKTWYQTLYAGTPVFVEKL